MSKYFKKGELKQVKGKKLDSKDKEQKRILIGNCDKKRRAQ